MFDKFFGWVSQKIHQWFRIALIPSQSRWGFVSLLFSACLFCIALSISVYAVHLSVVGGGLMLPLSAHVLFWVAVGLALLGLIGFIFVFSFAIYLLRHQGQDTSNTDINAIKISITSIQEILKEIPEATVNAIEARGHKVDENK